MTASVLFFYRRKEDRDNKRFSCSETSFLKPDSYFSEAVARRCSVKKMFLAISQKALGLELYKKEAMAQVFSCEFCDILRSPFLTEHLRWLLLIFAVEFVEFLICYKPQVVSRKFEHAKNFFLLFCLMFVI